MALTEKGVYSSYPSSSECVRNERYTYLRYPRLQRLNEMPFDRATPDKLHNIIESAAPQLVNSCGSRRMN